MSFNRNCPTLDDVYEVLGRDSGKHPILLHIKAGEKGPHWSGWREITYEKSLERAYQNLLRSNPNTGVALGVTDDLCAIDCDTDALLAEFLRLNPEFEKTLRTRGQSGGQLWGYITGERPHKIEDLAVKKDSPLAVGARKDPTPEGYVSIGEFRAEGGQSVIRGIHPNSFNYTWPVAQRPITIAFSSIKWPNDIGIGWLPKRPRDKAATPSAAHDETLLHRAIKRLTIADLWNHFGYADQEGKNPVQSPWFPDDEDTSFSIYNEGRNFKDHDPGRKDHRGDSFDFYQIATNQTASEAFKEFVKLAGLGDELHEAKNQEQTESVKPEPEPSVHGTNGKQPPPPNKDQKKRPELILPSGYVTFSDTAGAMFPVLAKRLRYFVRGRALVEIAYRKMMKDKQLHDIFQLLEADALRSRIEDDFECRAWRDNKKGKYIKKPSRCTNDAARVLLKTDIAFEYLPAIATLSAAPVLTGELGNLRILYKGYHDVHGGIYVTGGASKIVLPSRKAAIELILEILRDYDFISPSDKSRAVASFLSPAMRAGRLLGEVDFPIDIGEANDSQSGKTFRQKLVYTIYGETPYIIANREGGVGSLDESISSALIAGVPFIFFENFRGQMKSQLVETCLRGTGMAPARAPHKGEIQVPTGHINWQLSSNGLEATRDFVNRAIITRIAKRELGYKFHVYPEGNILAHIRANQAKYQAAIFRILIDWDQLGRQHTDETRHDFVEWTQALDWIMQNFFNLPPLLDGHVEEVLRVSDPALSWLRVVAIAVDKEKRLDEGLLATEIIDVCQARGVELPGVRGIIDPDQLSMYAGRLLNRLFRDTEELVIDRYKIRRDSRRDHQKNYTKHYYWFELKIPP